MFIQWLKKQVARKDDVGFVSRLVIGHSDAQERLEKHSCVMTRFINNELNNKTQKGMKQAHKEWKLASTAPKIGIFWDDNEIISFMDDAHNIPFDGLGFKNGKYNHDTMWQQVIKAIPTLKGTEYFNTKRGRVIQSKQNFIILLAPEDASDNDFINRIKREFRLPNTAKVNTDIHYSREIEDLNNYGD